jgi:hypothetical protein
MTSRRGVSLKGAKQMKSLDYNRYALRISVAAAMLAGCGGSQPPIAPPAAMPQGAAVVGQATHGRSMKPGSSGGDLIYAAVNFSGSQQGGVLILSYPAGTLEGTITGLKIPGGLCSDGNGNVFVTDFKAADILEYAHGGTSPINTLNDPGYYLIACSVDPTTGNLAVSGYDYRGHGAVAVYANAQGSPTTYSTPTDTLYCTYDSQGNLFVDGNESGVELAELPKGGSAFENITLNESIEYAGSFQWDGTYLALAAPQGAGRQKGPTPIYQVQVSGTTGTVVSTTWLISGKLDRNSGVDDQYWIQGGTILGADGKGGKIGLWRYPRGGKPFHVIRQGTNGYGLTVSVAPSAQYSRR